MASVDELIARAQRETGLDTFGDDSFVDGLTVLRDDVQACDRINEPGVERLEGLVVEHLARRLRISDYIARHPDVLDERIERPVLVMGMPRTATTAVINLLNNDPRRRTVLRWTLEDPVPPPTSDGLVSDPRCRAALDRQRRRLADGVAGANIRFEWADSPAECVHVMAHDFKAMQWEACGPLRTYSEFMYSCDMTSAYAWHKQTLQLLQSRAPGTWALKAPSHALWIEFILRTYPDARLVWTHRDPYTALASLCSLIANAHRRNCDDADIAYIAQRYPIGVAEHVRRPMALLDEFGDRIFHVHYADFMRDELASIRALYDWLGDELTTEAEQRMRTWLGDRRQAKLGEHLYSLEQFGLSRQALTPLFDEYVAHFAIELDGAPA